MSFSTSASTRPRPLFSAVSCCCCKSCLHPPLSTPPCPFQLLLYCSGGLAHPRSRLLRRRPRHADACPLHLLCNRTPTCRALVIARTLALTNPGPPSSHAASPNMHKSATAALVPGMVMIFTVHFFLELASDVNSCTKYRPCAASSQRNSMWPLSFLHPLFRSR